MNDKINITKEEFLTLDTKKQLDLVNSVLINGKTEDISKNFDFSYSWLSDKFKEKGIFFAGSIRKFIIEERAGALTDNELTELRGLLDDYRAFKSSNSLDVRLCAGCCGGETVTKSIVIDKEVNDMFNEFTKNINYISAKDLYTSAIKEFILKYDRDSN
ncbi:hypothetical protein [Clostridium sp.]|uniref:hypothetical protein n=1 Tax=Clostridium sp. TaxID=1506 RepID=UPI0029066F43|nr:hypothetical protein [Clostridium sp.]MDU5107764.1 hypothetical protein [Clostridium sp.]